MSDHYVTTPPGDKLDTELLLISGANVDRQRIESCVPWKKVVGLLTRPATTTTYTAADAMTDTGGAATPFTVGRFNGARGRIHSVKLLCEVNQALKLQAEMYLFDGTAAPTAVADNAAFALSDADLANIIGVVQFDGPTAAETFVTNAGAGVAGNAVIVGKMDNDRSKSLPFQCGAATTLIWALFLVRNAYIPLSSEVFRPVLGIEQN